MGKDVKLDYYLTRSASVSDFARNKLGMIKQIITPLSCRKFLDVGCGDGTITEMIGRILNTEDMFGLDISEIAVKEATKKGIRVVQADIENNSFPFDDNSFDLVFCGDFIEHVFDCKNLLDESMRVLKPEGFFILTTPNLGSWYNRISLLLGYQPFGTASSLHYPRAGKPRFSMSRTQGGSSIGDWGGEHIRVMTAKALKDVISFHGFEMCEVRGACGVLKTEKFIYRVVGIIDRLMSLVPGLSTWVIIKAKK